MSIGAIAAILTTSAFFPQVYKTIKTKQTEDLSLLMFLMMFAGTICWLIHGLNIDDKPIIYANIITGSMALIILMYKIRSMIKSKNQT